MKKLLVFSSMVGLALLGSILWLSKPTFAQTVKSGNNVNVPSNQSVDSTLFANGKTITIDGNVKGDVYCLGTNVVIAGNVSGDVLCAAQNLTISGRVEGNARIASQTVTITGRIGGSSTVFSQTLLIDKNSSITKDVVGLISGATINGQVGRDAGLIAQNVSINGSVGRNVKGQIDVLSVGGSGHIWGNIDYTSKSGASIATGAKVDGQITKREPKQASMNSSLLGISMLFIYVFVSLSLVSLLLAALFPQTLESAAHDAKQAPLKTLLFGLGSIIAVPAIITIAAITVIGIPLAGIVLLAWLLVISLCGPVFAYFIGKFLLRGRSKTHAVWVMFVGGSVVLIGYFIPLLNILVMGSAFIFGTGMVVRTAKKSLPKPVYVFNSKTIKK
jgi:cytoskeletal protein CcmA (bactofilin family)